MSNVSLKEVSTIKDTSNNIINEVWSTDGSLLYCKPVIVSNLGNISSLINEHSVDVQIQADSASNSYVVHRSKGSVHEFIYFKYDSLSNSWSVKVATSNNSSLGKLCTWYMSFTDEQLLAFYWGHTSGTYTDALNTVSMAFPHSSHFVADMSASNPTFISVTTEAASDSGLKNTLLAFVDVSSGALVTISVGYSNNQYYANCNRYPYSSTGWDWQEGASPYEIPLDSTYFNSKTSGVLRAIFVGLGLGDLGNTLLVNLNPLGFSGWYDWSNDFRLYVVIDNTHKVITNNYGVWSSSTSLTLFDKKFCSVNTDCYRTVTDYSFGNTSMCSTVNSFSLVDDKVKSIVRFVKLNHGTAPLRNPIMPSTGDKSIGTNNIRFFTRRNFSNTDEYINTTIIVDYGSPNRTYDKQVIEDGSSYIQSLQNFDNTCFYINYSGDLLYAGSY